MASKPPGSYSPSYPPPCLDTSNTDPRDKSLKLILPNALRLRPPHPLHPLLDDRAQDLEDDLRRRERRLLPVALIRRRDLDDVSADNIQPLDAPQDTDQFPRRPAPGFGRAGARRKRGVEDVDVDAQIHGVLGTQRVHDAFDDARRAEVVDVVGAEPDPALLIVVVEIPEPVARESRP